MSEANSPFFADGKADGERDQSLVDSGQEPLGKDGSKDWSVMYNRGYDSAFGGADGLDGVAVDMSPIEVDTSPI